MPGRTLHYTTSAGYRPQLVEIAPDAEDPASKRYHTIEEEDNNLNRNLGELEEGTRARNREFLRRLNEVWSQTSGWEAKLITEKKEAEESISQIKTDYAKHFENFQRSFIADVNSIFFHVDEELVPPHVDRVAREEEDLEFFIKDIVPKTVENQSGEVSRQLKKQYETFDIEKQKGSKKEKKFIAKANSHIQNTAQKFTDEAALLKACFFNLEEDIVYHERRSSRMHLRRYDNAVKDVVELQALVSDITHVRGVEDVDLLDTLIETQGLLQQTILEHFGAVDDAADRAPLNFEKLDQRLAKRDAHSVQSSKTGRSGGSARSQSSTA